MASLLTASCLCGFSKNNIKFGGTMSNFETVLMCHAIESRSGRFTVRNYYNHSIEGPDAMGHFDSGKIITDSNGKYIFYFVDIPT